MSKEGKDIGDYIGLILLIVIVGTIVIGMILAIASNGILGGLGVIVVLIAMIIAGGRQERGY